MRSIAPHVDGIFAAYALLNRGKKSFGINPKIEKAREIIYSLINKYDIIIRLSI